MDQQCPARGPGLGHAHADTCWRDHNGIHAVSECCHCGAINGEPVPPPPPPPEKVIAPFDVFEESKLSLPPRLEARYRPKPPPSATIGKRLEFHAWRFARMKNGGS